METATTKKKLLIFVPEFPLLTETFIEREVSELISRDNFDITLWSLKKGNVSLVSDISSRLKYDRLNKQNILELLINFIFSIFNKRFISTVNFVFKTNLSLKEKISLLVKCLGYYIWEIRKTNPDFIYVHFLSHPSSVIMVCSHYLNIPFGISAHAKDITVENELLSEKITNAKFITICNKHGYDYVTKFWGSVPSNVHLTYHGVDFDKLLVPYESATPVDYGCPVILTVGRLVEKKGHRYLIQASKILSDKNIKHKLLIAGPGPLYEDLQKVISDLSLESVVEILNSGKGVSFPETIKLYKSIKVFAFAGIETDSGDSDGVANVLIEAAAFAKPIVATNAGSTLELIKNNETGLVVKQKSPQELAEALEKLLTDSTLAAKLGNNAYIKCKELFDINHNILAIEKLLVEGMK